MNKHDIAIIGCWEVRNFGSHLTYYSLYSVLSQFGYKVLMIGCPKDAPYKSEGLPEYFYNIPYLSDDICPQFKTKREMRRANLYADTFIVGSDQMWNMALYKYFGSYAYLDFIHDNKKKIAYATSFGKANWDGDAIEADVISFLLKRFDAISVRESSGIEICNSVFHVNAEWRIDPVFLCDMNVFNALADKSDRQMPPNYVAAYVLDCDNSKAEELLKFSNNINCDLRILADPNINHKLSKSLPLEHSFYVEDWIKWIRDCEYFITDSFHGMCLAIIFNKPFTVIKNYKRGVARFDDYGKLFEIPERLLESFSELSANKQICKPLDYSKINRIIEQEKNASFQWLKSEIEKDSSNYEMSSYDVLSIQQEQSENRPQLSFNKVLNKIFSVLRIIFKAK